MHVAVDLNWFLQSIVTAFFLAFGFLYLVRNTASRYFVVDSSFDSSATNYSSVRKKGQNMAAAGGSPDACAVCGLLTTKQCSSCKVVKYCSEACQRSHWHSGHKAKCMELKSFNRANISKSTSASRGRKTSLVPLGGSSKILKQSNIILFPYEEFVELFKWDKPIYPPCGLLNCGNSCFANVVLQCLSHTRPLVAYLLEKGHRIECLRDDWCFLCEFQTHVERARQSFHPFSPINILSRLPNIGGNLGYGRQEDAHEFMRFAIDTMQSVCLDEFGGEKAVHPRYQETTLVQHIFGGHLQSQVICTKCNNVSNQIENMMDLTVEIHGDAGSLEECLDQFTAKEKLHGDNMYKCDGCNDYVMAWKRLTVHRAPNILTIALKRFQSGRFGKLNKRVTFPETLDLSPHVSELEDGNDVYKLYAVIVHVDMLNASFFGHYICYIKDFHGNWYRIDDCKVARVDLDEVLSQGAYMLLYSRICARPSCLLPAESVRTSEKEEVIVQPSECLDDPECHASPVDCGQSSSSRYSVLEVTNCGEDSSSNTEPDDARGNTMTQSSEASLHIFKDVELHDNSNLYTAPSEVAFPVKHTNQLTAANASLIDKNFTRLDIDHKIESTCPISRVGNGSCCSNGHVNKVLLKISTEESSPPENFTFEKHENGHDVSAMAFTTGEVFDEVNPVKPSMPEKCSKGSPSPDGIQDATKRSGESSVVKLKPIFTPGFLGRHTRNKSKREDKVSGESSGLTSKSHPNTQTNGLAKPLPLHLDGCFLKDEEKPCSVYENGNVSLESDVCNVIENGHSCDQIISGVGIKSN